MASNFQNFAFQYKIGHYVGGQRLVRGHCTPIPNHQVIMDQNWKQGKITVKAGDLHYYRIGQEGKTPILLIHGFTDNGLCWKQVANVLQDKYDVILPEMKSHGLSSRLQKRETIDMAWDVRTLIQTLNLSCPIIVGHSMGAMVTYQLGIRFPNLGKALVLEDPPWILPMPEKTIPTNRSLFEWAENLEYQSEEEIEAINRKDHPDWTSEMIRIMSESKKQFDPTSVDMFRKLFRKNNETWAITLNQLHIPTLLLRGDPRLGGLVSEEAAKKVKERNPGILIKEIPAVGHLIHFDKFTEFITIFFNFIREVEIN